MREVFERNFEEGNELPLNIQKGKTERLAAQGNQTEIFKTDVVIHQTKADAAKEETKTIALKINKRVDLASEGEFAKEKKFYEYLRKHPAFGKFVAETGFFIAKPDAGSNEKEYYKV